MSDRPLPSPVPIARRLLAIVAALFAAGCAPGGGDNFAPLELSWQPMAELNAALPAAVRVYAGVDPVAPLRAWYVRVRLGDGVTLSVAAAVDTDGVETSSQIAARTAARVVLNGGYFRMGEDPMRHVGLLMVDGEIVEPAVDSVLRDGERYYLARGALGFLENGSADIAWVSSRDGVLYAWEDPPPNTAAVPITELDLEGLPVWPARHAVAAGPVLAMRGEPRVTIDAEVFFGTKIPQLNPRTAAGVTPEGDLIVVVVDGRQRDSRGVSLGELADIMLELGSVEAVNLDGGGSSTLVVDGVLVNRPLGSQNERQVMSALLILEQ